MGYVWIEEEIAGVGKWRGPGRGLTLEEKSDKLAYRVLDRKGKVGNERPASHMGVLERSQTKKDGD